MDILTVRNLSKSFFLRTGFGRRDEFFAVQNVSFSLEQGACLGLVGESGCGKSTLARMLVGLLPATDGEILFKGRPVSENFHNPKALQMVFQDPFSSLNPRLCIGKSIGEPYKINNSGCGEAAVREKVREILQEVGLEKEYYSRYPHEFSGGQRQRIAIARAIVTKPELLVCDEPVSALDASHQAQVLNLLLDLKEKYRLSYLFISHNLQVVSFMCDAVLVMYAGEIVEYAAKEDLFANPLHPYTKALTASAPSVGKKTENAVLQGEAPGLMHRKQGCSFAGRCAYAQERCRREKPLLRSIGKNGHKAACHLHSAR